MSSDRRLAARGGAAGAVRALLASLLVMLLAFAAVAPIADQAKAQDQSQSAADTRSAARAQDAATLVDDEAAHAELVDRLLNDPSSALSGKDERAASERLLAEWEEAAKRVEANLAEPTRSTPAFEVMRDTLAGHRGTARLLAQKARQAIAPLQAQMEALGPAPAPEAPPEDEAVQGGGAGSGAAGSGADGAEGAAGGAGDAGARARPGVAGERRALAERIADLEALESKALLANARADALVNEIDDLIRGRFADQLRTVGPTPLNPAIWPGALADSGRLALLVVGESLDRLSDERSNQARAAQLPAVALLLAGVAAVLFWLRRRLMQVVRARVSPRSSRARRLGMGALSTLIEIILPMVAVSLLRVALEEAEILGPTGATLADHAAGGALIFIAARGLALAFYAPDAPRLRISGLEDAKARRASLWAQGLGLAAFLQTVFVEAGEKTDLGEATLAVINFGCLLLGALSLWRLARLVRPARSEAAAPSPQEGDLWEPEPETVEGVGRRVATIGAFLMRAAAVVAVLMAAAGYYAASQFAFYPVVYSLGVLCAGVLVFIMLREGVEAYLERTGADGGGLRLLPALVGLLLCLLSLPLLALIWGARTSDLVEAWTVIVDGTDVGGVHVSPGDFLWMIVAFVIVYGLTRLLQVVLAGSVLPNTRLDAGGRNAITAGVGYLGFILAGLAGISAAGIDLSNIALIAGALGVGIGFGLQAIVSNFVSGIILLVERPIKVGDWILVGGDHGIVKRVSVRATEIETFDKTSLFLPNSDLVTGKVVNYTHNNNAGRLILKIPVAYGTPPREVERILLELARADGRVLRYPAPMVLIAGFGENGMQFELRVFLRDILQIFAVQTDMYCEIESALRGAGIEIPMAQRVLHVREAGPLTGTAGPYGRGGAQREEPGTPAPTPGRRRGDPAESAQAHWPDAPDGGEST